MHEDSCVHIDCSWIFFGTFFLNRTSFLIEFNPFGFVKLIKTLYQLNFSLMIPNPFSKAFKCGFTTKHNKSLILKSISDILNPRDQSINTHKAGLKNFVNIQRFLILSEDQSSFVNIINVYNSNGWNDVTLKDLCPIFSRQALKLYDEDPLTRFYLKSYPEFQS